MSYATKKHALQNSLSGEGFLVGSWTNTCEIPVDLVVVNDADGGEVQTSVCAASY